MKKKNKSSSYFNMQLNSIKMEINDLSTQLSKIYDRNSKLNEELQKHGL